jgi:hypothetical protein
MSGICVLASVISLIALPLSYRFYAIVGLDTDRLHSPERVYLSLL